MQTAGNWTMSEESAGPSSGGTKSVTDDNLFGGANEASEEVFTNGDGVARIARLQLEVEVKGDV
jgi:hypothetical protein